MNPEIQEWPNLVLEIVTSHEVPMRNTSTQWEAKQCFIVSWAWAQNSGVLWSANETMLSAQQVLPKQRHDNGQSNTPPAPERLVPETQRQRGSEHFSAAPGPELAWEAWHRTRTLSLVWLPYGRTQERRGDTCRKAIL